MQHQLPNCYIVVVLRFTTVIGFGSSSFYLYLCLICSRMMLNTELSIFSKEVWIGLRANCWVSKQNTYQYQSDTQYLEYLRYNWYWYWFTVSIGLTLLLPEDCRQYGPGCGA
jgi:hypothetical protein